jgi:hypothetical protein
MIILEKWGIVSTNPFMAPERQTKFSLKGIVYNHPIKEDGKEVVTSFITNIEGNIVTTYSGSKYILGPPNPEYLEFLNKNGFVFDPADPLKSMKKSHNTM